MKSKVCAHTQLIFLMLSHVQNAHEFSELPVRHNEDHVNSELAAKLPLSVDPHTYDSSNTKTHLLLQAHFSRVPLPSADYHTDTKSVMDQVLRVLQVSVCVSLLTIFLDLSQNQTRKPAVRGKASGIGTLLNNK